jgi:hypothetical protein
MSNPKSRYIVTYEGDSLPGIPWRDVSVGRNPGMYTVYKLTEVARGTPAELAAMADPDAPAIEVVGLSRNCVIVCGEHSWVASIDPTAIRGSAVKADGGEK